MTEVLLINPCSVDPPPVYFGPPYGLALIAAVLEKNGKRPVCLDLERYDYDAAISKIRSSIDNIKYVGISSQSCNRGVLYRMIRDIRSMKDVVIILGGPFATQMHRMLLDNHDIDYIVMGDGEITMDQLIDGLESHDISKVKGIAYKSERSILVSQDQQASHLDDLPYPAFHLFDVPADIGNDDFLRSEVGKRKIKDARRCVSIPNTLMLLSSIGCIYGCSFCPMSGVNKVKYRSHSPEYFAEMVEHFVKKYDLSYVVFGDNFFTRDISRTKEICLELITRDLKIDWACMTRTDYLDYDLVRLMRLAGCHEISFGVESMSPEIQIKMGKNLDLSSVRKAFEMCKKEGIRSVLMLMVGNEGESKKTIYQTLSRVRHLCPDEVLVKITKVYPGTRLHEKMPISQGYYLGTDPEPPAFTVENTLEDLKRFRDMIGLRDVRIKTGSCNNNCIFCNRHNKTTDEIKDILLRSARRADSITLAHEPAIRKDFAELVRYARTVGVSKINIETNARIFSLPKAIDMIEKMKLDRIIVSINSIDKKVFEMITCSEGSFIQTMKGLANLIELNKDIEVVVRILEQNYKEIPQIAKAMDDMGIKKMRLIYRGGPGYEDIREYINNAFDIGIEINTDGLPYCLMPEHEDSVLEIRRPFDECDLDNAGEKRRLKRYKDDRCIDCRWDMICEGWI